MKKVFTRILVTVLSALMLIDSCSLSVLAEGIQTEEEFRLELEASVDAEEYPDGVFDFLSPRMQTSEGIGFVEFAVVRRGNTDHAASVNFKAIDMSAEYGTDYTITVLDGLFGTKIEKNDDAVLYIDQVDIEPIEEPAAEEGEESSDEIVEEVSEEPLSETEEEASLSGEEAEEEEVFTEEEYTETALKAEPYDGTLLSAVRKSTGKNYQSRDWRAEDTAMLEALDEASKEMYDDISGHEITLDFAAGEYKKVLRFYTVDDKISEDEEQVLFVLSHAENADLVPNPTGYMNIVDNEEREESTYCFKESFYSVAKDADTVTVEIRRLTGIHRYDKLILLSGEDTATVGEHYDEVYQEVMFVPGSAVKSVEIPIKKHPLAEAVSFRLYTDDYAASTLISIDPVIETGTIYTETEAAPVEEGTATLMAVPTRKASVDLLSTGFKRSYSGYHFAHDTIIEINNGWLSFSGIDLTMVSSMTFTHSENGSGTSYSYKSGCSTKTGWHTKKYNAIEISGQGNNVKRYGTFGDTTETIKLDIDARKKNSTVTLKSLGEEGCNDTHGVFDRYVVLNYEPFFVDTSASDPADSIIRPNVYDQTGKFSPRKITVDGKEKNYEFVAGTMQLKKTGTTKNYFFENDYIEVEPVWDENLTEEERNGVYLWGIKFERAASGPKTEYYYYKGTSFFLSSLYTGSYTDYYTGKPIGKDCILNDGETRGFKILPVFRQKTAFTKLEVIDDAMFDPGTFHNSDVIVTGRLDEIRIGTSVYDGKMVAGWNAYYDSVNPSEKTELNYYADETLRSKNEDQYKKIKASGSDKLNSLYTSTWSQGLGTSRQLNYGEAYPGKLSFHPIGMFNYVTATYTEPSITVSVNPRPANYADQKVGQVVYFDEETESGQYADYTGREGYYARGHEIVIAPYTLVPYNFTAVTDQPPEGYTYKVNWVDYTGDTNRDGELSEEELKALGSSVNALYGDFRRVYAGNTFSYMPKIVGDSTVYYQFRKVSASDADPDAPKRSLRGTVVLKSRTVIENTENGPYTMMPVVGAVVQVGDLSTLTDENGRWEISSDHFEGDEIYSVNVSYSGRIYNFNVTVGQYALEMPIAEYDTFDVTDFKIKQGSSVIAPGSLTAEDVRHRYSFRITSLVPGIVPEKVEVYRFSKSDTLQAVYNAYLDPGAGEWVIRNDKALEGFNKEGDDKEDYSFNPMGESVPVAAGDYLMIRITDNNGVSYIPHDAGVRYKAHLGMISVVNTLVPKSGVVLDYIEKVGSSFDLGFSTTLDSGLRSGLEAAGVKFEEKTKDGVYTEMISWGWNTDFSKKYKPKEEKKDDDKEKDKDKDEDEDEKDDEDDNVEDDDENDDDDDEAELLGASLSASGVKLETASEDTALDEARDAVRESAGNLDSVSAKAENEKTDEEKNESEENDDETKKKEASELAKEAIDKKKNKKRSEFAANISLDFSVAVSLELGYDEEQDAWYFVEFLVVGTVAADASAAYSYMTPIGVKIGIKATLSGDITAMFGYSEYVKNPMHPEHIYLSETGGLDIGAMGNRDINRKMNVYGKLMVRPTVTLGINAALISENIASVSLVGSAAFDMNFTTASTGAGNVTLAADLELSLLFGLIKKKWSLAKKTYSMFEYANEPQLFDLMGDGTDLRYETITSADINDEPSDPVSWNGDMNENLNASLMDTNTAAMLEEHILSENFESEGMPKIERIHSYSLDKTGKKMAILIFLDAKEAGSSIKVLKYSFLVDDVWSEPVAFDPDSMGDDSHNIQYIGDDRIIVSWSTNTDTELSDDPKERLNHRKIKTVIYDINEDAFGPIRDLTKMTDGDIYADSTADFAYYQSDEGKEYMVATYRKMIYESVNVGEDEATLMVGDVLNAATYVAYRFYDFGKDDWIDKYDESYLDMILDTEEEKIAFRRDMYGQYFVDLSDYISVDPSLNMTPEELRAARYPDTRNMGIWKHEPTADDLRMNNIGMKYQIISQNAASYHGKAVFIYLVDTDGNESTPTDREIYMVVYDFLEDKICPPIRLTNNDLSENNTVITDLSDGLRLYYSQDGSIVMLKISNILDHGLVFDTTYRGIPCKALIENRLPKYAVEPFVVLSKESAGDGTDEKRYDDFSMDWDTETEYLFYTEPMITYAEGLTAQDPEAALPENQYSERQLNMIFHASLSYPIDTTDEEGDPITVTAYEDLWWPNIQLTSEQGENVLYVDSVFDGAYINSVFVKAYSELTEVDGVMVPTASKNKRQLVLAKFDPYLMENFSEELDVEFENINDVFYAGDTFDLQLAITNPSFMEDDELFIRVYQKNGDGKYEKTDEMTIGRVYTYETKHVTIPMTLPEDLRDLDFYVEVSNRYFDIETVLGRAEYRYTQPQDAMKIRSFEKTLLGRNRVQYNVTVENPSNVLLENEKLAIEIGDEYYLSDPFELTPGETRIVSLEADVSEDAFTEERTDTMIYERANVTISSESEVREDVIERAGRLEYEALLDDIQLINGLTGEEMDTVIVLNKDGYALPRALPKEYSENSLMLVADSADPAIASVDGLSGIIGTEKGKTKVTLHIAPRVAGYMARLQDSTETELYNDYNTLPSALIRDVELVVAVTEPSDKKPVVVVDPDAEKKDDTETGDTEDNGNTEGGEGTEGSETDPGVPEKTFGFTDVAENDWYYGAVKYAFDKGLLKGISDELFDPNGKVTRGMFATVIWRLDGELQANLAMPFNDVPDGRYDTEAIRYAAAKGYVKGISEDTFAPDAYITREQMATILCRYAEKKGISVSADAVDDTLFGDASSVSDWARDGMKFCIAKGLIKGDENRNLRPQYNATRAEFAAILQRAENILY